MKGVYALIIRLNRNLRMKAGALDETCFVKGSYIYVGSAQTNLEQRVKRHIRKEKRLFWHIDYLLNSDAAKIEKVLWLEADKSGECALSQEIRKRGESIKGFGSSDCSCVSHLFLMNDYTFLLEKMKPLILDI